MTKTPEQLADEIVVEWQNTGTCCDETGRSVGMQYSTLVKLIAQALQEREAKLVSALKFYSDNFHDDGETARQALKEVGVL
jgi:hypothetical protein